MGSGEMSEENILVCSHHTVAYVIFHQVLPGRADAHKTVCGRPWYDYFKSYEKNPKTHPHKEVKKELGLL